MKKIIVRLSSFIPLVIVSLLFLNCSSKKSSNLPEKENENISGRREVQSKTSQKKFSEDITFITSDNLNISGKYYYSIQTKEAPEPLVILIHQFKQSKEQWAEWYIDSLIATGFKVLTYDIRGHGKSSDVNYELTKLLSDPEGAPKDIEAIIEWTSKKKGIDSAKIGIMGTSIGGNIGLYARRNLGVKTVVSVSGSKDGFFALNSMDERMMSRPIPRINYILLITAAEDGSHKADVEYLAENFLIEPFEVKIYDSEKHGKYLIEEFPIIYSLSLNWFKKYL